MRHDKQGFTSKTIHLEHLIDSTRAILGRSFTYIDVDGVKYTAHPPMPTDGGSVPKFFYRVIGPPFASPYLAAYIIHDWLCREAEKLAVNGFYYEAVVTRKEADLLFKEMLSFLGCNRVKVRAMYRAVRFGSGSLRKYKKKRLK